MFINKPKKENKHVGISRSSLANKKRICLERESLSKKDGSDKIVGCCQR